MTRLAASPLPIPPDVTETAYFSPLMLDLAGHIGVYDTLRLCDAFGGRYLYLALRGPKDELVDLLGRDKAELMCRIYGLETLLVPTARAALAHARRAPILRQVMSGERSAHDAAAMIDTSVEYIYKLVKQLRDGCAARGEPLLRRVRQVDPRQTDLIDWLGHPEP